MTFYHAAPAQHPTPTKSPPPPHTKHNSLLELPIVRIQDVTCNIVTVQCTMHIHIQCINHTSFFTPGNCDQGNYISTLTRVALQSVDTRVHVALYCVGSRATLECLRLRESLQYLCSRVAVYYSSSRLAR